jgi:hypothetical protein
MTAIAPSFPKLPARVARQIAALLTEEITLRCTISGDDHALVRDLAASFVALADKADAKDAAAAAKKAEGGQAKAGEEQALLDAAVAAAAAAAHAVPDDHPAESPAGEAESPAGESADTAGEAE